MFGSFIRFVDSLFWETRITTTVTIKRRYVKPASIRKDGFTLMTNDFSICENTPIASPADVEEDTIMHQPMIEADGRKFILPSVVQLMPSILKEDGSLNYLTFPAYRGAPLISCFTGNGRKMSAVDGQPLSRTGEVCGWTRQKAVVNASRCDDLIARGRVPRYQMERYQDVDLFVTLHSDWIYILVRHESGSHIRLYQENIGQFAHESECVTMAFGFARSIILILGAADQEYKNIAESNLAQVLLSLIIKAKA